MNEIDSYIRKVMGYIHAPERERQRIESDLRTHLDEAQHTGEPVDQILNRMGDPKEVAEGFMAQMDLRYAGFWIRLAAFVLDFILIIAVSTLFAIPAIVIADLIPERNPAGFEIVLGAILLALLFALGLAIVSMILLYFPILEGRFGRTVGKSLLRLRVLKEDGLPIGYKEAVLRRLSFYFEIFAVDALFIPFTPKKQRAFDIVAKTVVVREQA